MRKIFSGIIGLLGLLIVIYLLGPKAPKANLNTSLPTVTSNLIALETEIEDLESKHPNIRPDNEARIVWYDETTKSKTPYSLVYLHGFSASQGEGAPMHTDFAKRYGCNLYLARLFGHGIRKEGAMSEITPEKLMESAKRAIAIGQQIGEKVIVMGTSTGCTAALYLASGNPDLAAIINYSPNIAIADPNAKFMTYPWGLKIAQTVTGSNYHSWVPSKGTEDLVTNKYLLDAAVALQATLDESMTEEVFTKITQPFFMGYWYKNEEVQDDVVSVAAMLQMYEQINTPENLKRKIAFPNATNHVLASPLWNNDFETVKKATFDFADNVLQLEIVSTNGELETINETQTVN